MAVLIVQRPGHNDERFPLEADSLKIGRDDTNDVVVDDRTVSREHALITCSPRGHAIKDLGSRNGTWVGEERVNSAARDLRDGDLIRLGRQVCGLFLTEEATMSDTMGDGRLFRAYGSMVFGHLAEGSRQLRLLKLTPWLRMAAAVLGVLAGTLSLLWWSLKVFVN